LFHSRQSYLPSAVFCIACFHTCCTLPLLPLLLLPGVRARQEKVPFAILDDPSVAASDVSPLLGQHIALTVTPDSVSIAPATSEQLAAAAAAASGKARGAAAGASAAKQQQDEAAAGPAGAVSKVSSVRLLPLLDCMPTLAGAKASSCARLEQVGFVLHAYFCAFVVTNFHQQQ
jgi:hypothetical protein